MRQKTQERANRFDRKQVQLPQEVYYWCFYKYIGEHLAARITWLPQPVLVLWQYIPGDSLRVLVLWQETPPEYWCFDSIIGDTWRQRLAWLPQQVLVLWQYIPGDSLRVLVLWQETPPEFGALTSIFGDTQGRYSDSTTTVDVTPSASVGTLTVHIWRLPQSVGTLTGDSPRIWCFNSTIGDTRQQRLM